jgi:mRNA-capping enzyme
LFVVFLNVRIVAIAGWLDCPAFGEPIDKIIPSKVPLDETFNETVPPGKRYSSKQLVTKQRKAGREVSISFFAQIML